MARVIDRRACFRISIACPIGIPEAFEVLADRRHLSDLFADVVPEGEQAGTGKESQQHSRRLQ
jgi:hypothetical protein